MAVNAWARFWGSTAFGAFEISIPWTPSLCSVSQDPPPPPLPAEAEETFGHSQRTLGLLWVQKVFLVQQREAETLCQGLTQEIRVGIWLSTDEPGFGCGNLFSLFCHVPHFVILLFLFAHTVRCANIFFFLSKASYYVAASISSQEGKHTLWLKNYGSYWNGIWNG